MISNKSRSRPTCAITVCLHIRTSRYGRCGGFSAIELLVALAIVGILGAVALPAYLAQARKSYRAEAKAIVMETAQFMERYYTTNKTYVGAAVLSSVSPKGTSGTSVRYNVSFSVTPTISVYTVQAVPANGQTGDPCGTLTLSNTGVQTAATTNCW